MKINFDSDFYYRVLNGDTINSICEKFNSSKENIIRNNNFIELYEGEWIKIKVNNYIIHYVKPMENLESISKKYNIQKEKIILDNNLTCEKLFIGQSIKIY